MSTSIDQALCNMARAMQGLMTTQNPDNVHSLAIKMYSGTIGIKTKVTASNPHGRESRTEPSLSSQVNTGYSLLALQSPTLGA